MSGPKDTHPPTPLTYQELLAPRQLLINTSSLDHTFNHTDSDDTHTTQPVSQLCQRHNSEFSWRHSEPFLLLPKVRRVDGTGPRMPGGHRLASGKRLSGHHRSLRGQKAAFQSTATTIHPL